MNKLVKKLRRLFFNLRVKSLKIGPIILEPEPHERHSRIGTADKQPELSEESIRTADPNDVIFQEIEIKLSDTWKGFLDWLNDQIPESTISCISEDTYREASFYCSGKPGSLSWPIYVEGKRGNTNLRQNFDLVRDWLHPTALRLAPPNAGLPWDTSLFPIKRGDGKELLIDSPNTNLRDAVYGVLFASL